LGSLPISHRGTRDLCAKEGDTNFWQVFTNVMMMCNYRLSPDRVKIISRHSCTIIARVHSRQGRNFIYLLLINVKHFNNHNSQRKSAQLKFMKQLTWNCFNWSKLETAKHLHCYICYLDLYDTTTTTTTTASTPFRPQFTHSIIQLCMPFNVSGCVFLCGAGFEGF